MLSRFKSKHTGVVLLLEVVVGLGVFVAAILFVFGIFASSQKATVSSKNLAIACDLGREVMETELARGYDDLTEGPSAPVNLPVETEVDGVKTTTTFTTEVDVETKTPGTKKGVDDFERKHILVTVSWPEVTGFQRKTTLETIVVP